MSLRKEVQDVVDKWTEARADETLTPEEAHQITREVVDVVKYALTMDSSDASKEDLSGEIESAINAIADSVLSDRPIVRGIVKTFTDNAAGKIVEEIAKYSGNAQDFWRDKIDPILSRWEETLHSVRAIGG